LGGCSLQMDITWESIWVEPLELEFRDTFTFILSLVG